MARKKQDLESVEFEGEESADLPEMGAVVDEQEVDQPAEPESAEPEPAEPESAETVVFPLPEGDYLFTPVLSGKGHSSGPAVRQVREWLGLSDGSDYDAETVEAVREFQQSSALPPSGVVDVGTWRALSSR